MNESDPSLSPDKRVMLFSTADGANSRELRYATRQSPTAPFSTPVALDQLNEPNVNDGDPSVSSDGCELLFISERPGEAFDLFVARVQTPTG